MDNRQSHAAVFQRGTKFGFLVVMFIHKCGIFLAIASSLLIRLLGGFLPIYFNAQPIILSFCLNCLILLKHPWAPKIRDLAHLIFARLLYDRPLLPKEEVSILLHGASVYVYITTVLFCSDWRIALWAFGPPIALPACMFSQLVFNPIIAVLSTVSLDFIGKAFRPPRVLQRSPEYEYEDLASLRHIRILKIKRKIPFRPLQCELISVSIDSAPCYDAISYTWGAPDLPKRISMTNGTLLPVTRKVSDIIHERASFVRQRLLWIDAVCIWQTNHREKACQLNLMREIYERASRTIIWLGEQPNDCNIHRAVRLLRQALRTERMGWLGSLQRTQMPSLAIRYEKEKFALLEMLLNPYWLRVWIIQEIALQKTVHILYGDTWFLWEEIIEVLGAFGSLNPISAVRFPNMKARLEQQNGGQLAQIAVIARLKGWIDEGRGLTAARIVHLCSRSRATVDRDKIYGVLGLTGQDLVTPDYTNRLTTADVFRDSARRMLETAGPDQMFVLHKAGIGYPRKTIGLPSWAPDWAHPPHPSPLAKGFVGDMANDQYRAALGFTPDKPDIRSDNIQIRGLLVDTVTAVIQTVLDPDMDALLQPGATIVVRCIAEARRLVLGSFAVEARCQPDHLNNCFWRTLTGNRWKESRPSPTPYLRNCDAWCQRIIQAAHLEDEYRGFDFGTTIALERHEQLPTDVHMRNLVPTFGSPLFTDVALSFIFENSIREALFGRRFGVTANGYMVLLPPESVIGDRIYVIEGGETPFTFRSEETTKTWQLVGETYVHGMMDGERVRQGGVPELLVIK